MSKDDANRGPAAPIDGWLRNQQEMLPQLDAECEDKLAKLDREGEAVRAAHETIKRAAAALGITLPSQRKEKSPVPAKLEIVKDGTA